VSSPDATHVRAHFEIMRERDGAALAKLLAAMDPRAGESAPDYAARLASAVAAFKAQRAEAAAADRVALAAAAQLDIGAAVVPPQPYRPDPNEEGWKAALAACARSAAANPKAWALIRGVLGASFPTASLDPARGAGAARLEELCIAAAAAESRIASVESAAAAAWLVRHFEPHPQPQHETARGNDSLELFAAIRACRLLWELPPNTAPSSGGLR